MTLYHLMFKSVRTNQTPSTGLRHPSSIRCRNRLRHRSLKTVSWQTVYRWCTNGSKFVTDNSNYIRRLEKVAGKWCSECEKKHDYRCVKKEDFLDSCCPLNQQLSRWTCQEQVENLNYLIIVIWRLVERLISRWALREIHNGDYSALLIALK